MNGIKTVYTGRDKGSQQVELCTRLTKTIAQSDKMARSGFTLSILLVLFLAIGTEHPVDGTRVSLIDNGYVNLVVAIAESTPRDQSKVIIENIQVRSIVAYQLSGLNSNYFLFVMHMASEENV